MFVGKSVLRREDARLLGGKGQYVGDLELPGMLHAAFVRSPMAHRPSFSAKSVVSKISFAFSIEVRQIGSMKTCGAMTATPRTG